MVVLYGKQDEDPYVGLKNKLKTAALLLEKLTTNTNLNEKLETRNSN